MCKGLLEATCKGLIQVWVVQGNGPLSTSCTSVIVGGGPPGKLVLGDVFFRAYFT